MDLWQISSIDLYGLCLDQYESDPAPVQAARVAPQVVGAPLNNDVTGRHSRHGAAFELQLEFTGEQDTVVD